MKEVPPFHLTDVIALVINRLDRVELWWNYGWNYMKFHPNSTRNSTTFKHLIIKTITLITVKSLHFYGSNLFLGHRKIRLFLVKSVLTRQQNQGTVFQTALFYLVIIPRLRPGLLSLCSVLSSRQTTKQPDNQTPTTKHQQPIIIYFYLLIFYFSTKQPDKKIHFAEKRKKRSLSR